MLLALLALSLVWCLKRSAPAARTRGPARLVLSVVLDQVCSWVLDRYLPRLRPDGALRRAIARGAFHHRVTYAYAGTYTAPGHAAIYTGRAPEGSGVGMNRALLRGRRSTESIVEDHAHAVFGARGETAAPALLQCETVADPLRGQTGGRAPIGGGGMKCA